MKKIMDTEKSIASNFATGTKIPELVKSPDYKQIFMFSAITWNRHEIHYNHQFAQKEGHKSVVVQRALFGNYLSQLLTDWIGQQGELTFLEWKVIRSAIPGDTLICQGEVSGSFMENGLLIIKCKVQIINQNSEIIVTGNSKILISS